MQQILSVSVSQHCRQKLYQYFFNRVQQIVYLPGNRMDSSLCLVQGHDHYSMVMMILFTYTTTDDLHYITFQLKSTINKPNSEYLHCSEIYFHSYQHKNVNEWTTKI